MKDAEWLSLVVRSTFGRPAKTLRETITDTALACSDLRHLVVHTKLESEDVDDLSFILPVLEEVVSKVRDKLGLGDIS